MSSGTMLTDKARTDEVQSQDLDGSNEGWSFCDEHLVWIDYSGRSRREG